MVWFNFFALADPSIDQGLLFWAGVCLFYNAAWMMTSSNGNIFRVTGHLCGEFIVPGEFPIQRPVTRNFNVFFDLRLNKRLSKQSWGWWFEMLSRPLWRHRNVSSLDALNFHRFPRFSSGTDQMIAKLLVIRAVPILPVGILCEVLRWLVDLMLTFYLKNVFDIYSLFQWFSARKT